MSATELAKDSVVEIASMKAELQQQCNSPYIVKLYDFYLGPRYAVYVMEYVPHTLLERIVERNTDNVYSESETARYVKEVALALRACHSP